MMHFTTHTVWGGVGWGGGMVGVETEGVICLSTLGR